MNHALKGTGAALAEIASVCHHQFCQCCSGRSVVQVLTLGKMTIFGTMLMESEVSFM